MTKKFVISSVSASGKTTLVNALLESHNEIYRLITCTSRPIRPEENGNEYYFHTADEMHLMHMCNKFVEVSTVYGNWYGLSKEEVEAHPDNNVIAILDVQGQKKFKKQYPEAITIFIEPPPLKILRERLTSRNTNDADVTKRMSEIQRELTEVKKYDELIRYGELDVMKSNFINTVLKHIDKC